jgi:hypothetical protein
MRSSAIALLCLACCFAGEKAPAAKSTPDDVVIAKVRDSFWEAFKKKDVETLRGVMADDYLEPTGSGTAAKADVLAVVTQVNVTDFAMDHFKVIWLGKNSAIVSYEVHQHWTLNGQDGPPHVRASTALENRGGKWLIVFHQETIAK